MSESQRYIPPSPEQRPPTPTSAAESFLDRLDRKQVELSAKWQPVLQTIFGVSMIAATDRMVNSLSKGDTTGAIEAGVYGALNLVGSVKTAIDSRRAFNNAEQTIRQQQQTIQRLQGDKQPKSR